MRCKDGKDVSYQVIYQLSAGPSSQPRLDGYTFFGDIVSDGTSSLHRFIPECVSRIFFGRPSRIQPTPTKRRRCEVCPEAPQDGESLLLVSYRLRRQGLGSALQDKLHNTNPILPGATCIPLRKWLRDFKGPGRMGRERYFHLNRPALTAESKLDGRGQPPPSTSHPTRLVRQASNHLHLCCSNVHGASPFSLPTQDDLLRRLSLDTMTSVVLGPSDSSRQYHGVQRPDMVTPTSCQRCECRSRQGRSTSSPETKQVDSAVRHSRTAHGGPFCSEKTEAET